VTAETSRKANPMQSSLATGARARIWNLGSSIPQISADQILEEGPGKSQFLCGRGGGMVDVKQQNPGARRGKR